MLIVEIYGRIISSSPIFVKYFFYNFYVKAVDFSTAFETN